MYGLSQTKKNDSSRIAVTYYQYSSGSWCYATTSFESQEYADRFIADAKKDFNIRLNSVESLPVFMRSLNRMEMF